MVIQLETLLPILRENPLYLPQLNLFLLTILLAESVKDPYNFDITRRIYRHENLVVEGTASTRQLKREFEELVSFLARDNEIFDGTVLLTGTLFPQ